MVGFYSLLYHCTVNISKLVEASAFRCKRSQNTQCLGSVVPVAMFIPRESPLGA